MILAWASPFNNNITNYSKLKKRHYVIHCKKTSTHNVPVPIFKALVGAIRIHYLYLLLAVPGLIFSREDITIHHSYANISLKIQKPSSITHIVVETCREMSAYCVRSTLEKAGDSKLMTTKITLDSYSNYSVTVKVFDGNDLVQQQMASFQTGTPIQNILILKYDNVQSTRIPANAIRSANVGLMLVHPLRRWPNIKPTMGQKE